MRTPHLRAAAAALLLAAIALVIGVVQARRAERAAVHALAPQMFALKAQGLALQRAAVHAPDLLPFYGSSDLKTPSRFHASALFRDYPTAFTVFPVAQLGATSLIWLQALAANGADLRDRQVALSLAAHGFLSETVDRHAYAANFSALHAGELAFSPRLSFDLKRDVARRLLAYPETLTDDPLLRAALELLADGSIASRVAYDALLPLGWLRNAALRLQDHWRALAFLRAQVGLAAGPRQAAALDWRALDERADDATRRAASGNPFGVDAAVWATRGPDMTRQRDRFTADSARLAVERSEEWTDLALLLRVAGELGARPLLLGIPMHAPYHDHLGVPAAVRDAQARRLRALAAAHGAALADFADHDAAVPFTTDATAHLSDAGWVRYDRALDAFVHHRPAGGS